MNYVIEDGVPPPPAMRRTGIQKTALRIVMESMRPGQSLLLDTPEENALARSAASHIGAGRFRSRKVAGKGWRVWRME